MKRLVANAFVLLIFGLSGVANATTYVVMAYVQFVSSTIHS